MYAGKTLKKRLNNAYNELSQVPRVGATLEAKWMVRVCSSVKMVAHSGFIIYTIHAYHCEIGLDALRVVSLKKARECATQVYLVWGVLFYMKGRDFIKESEKKSVKQCVISII